MKGDVVVVPFPFSDLSRTKRRPALVLAELTGDDVILCQITSQGIRDQYAIAVEQRDFEKGGLKHPSNVRPNRLFTCDRRIILYPVGRLDSKKIGEIISKVVELLRN